jgi:molybdenum cofactor biosynthesis enzyme MoaA
MKENTTKKMPKEITHFHTHTQVQTHTHTRNTIWIITSLENGKCQRRRLTNAGTFSWQPLTNTATASTTATCHNVEPQNKLRGDNY